MQAVVREILPADPESTVLDVGCGTGGNIAALADDYRCLGIDTSSEAIELARRAAPDVEFVRGTPADDLADMMSQVRLVMLMDVLEHVPDDFSLLSQLLASSSPGTYFLLTVPADMQLWSVHDESFGHYRRYDMARFARLWRDLPVRELLASYFNTRLYPVVRYLRRRNQKRGRTSGEAGTDLHVPARPINALLETLFAGERHALIDVLRGHRDDGYTGGVSLMAVLQRGEGEISHGLRPADVAADPYDPGELQAV
jgi:SAM-dependent methyltransferase